MFPISQYVETAVHHGLIVAVSFLLATYIVRWSQHRVGRFLNHEVMLPAPKMWLVGLAGLGTGLVGAGIHWKIAGGSHRALDAFIVSPMALGGIFLVWRALDDRYRISAKAVLIIFAGQLVATFILCRFVDKPQTFDWFSAFEGNLLVGAATLVLFPSPPRPQRVYRGDPPAPGGGPGSRSTSPQRPGFGPTSRTSVRPTKR